MSVIKNILTIEVPTESFPTRWNVWWNNPENNREFGRLFTQRFNKVVQNYVFLHAYFRYSFEAVYRMAYFLKHECL